MLLKFTSFSLVGYCLLIFAPIAIAASPKDACHLPQGLRHRLASRYPGARLVHLSDLSEDDRGFFEAQHEDACPGKASVDFYGDGKPTLALVLIAEVGGKQESILIVAHQVGARWSTTLLDSGDSSMPVVWSQSPGEYEDVYGDKKIRAHNPVIVLCQYEAWSILYAWTNNRVEKIWLSD